MREKHPSVKKLHKLSHNGSPSEDVAQSNIFEPQRSRLWRSLNISGPICLTGTDGVSEEDALYKSAHHHHHHLLWKDGQLNKTQ